MRANDEPPNFNHESSFEEEEESSGSGEEESEYRQRQAFHIPDVQEQGALEPDQLQAFQYLLSVRQQAETIKDVGKKARKEGRKQERKQKEEKSHSKEEGKKENSLPEWFQAWKSETIQNWRCVVENLKYLHKQSNPSLCLSQWNHLVFNPKSQPSALLSQKPKMELIQQLPLGVVEELMRTLSEEQFGCPGKYYYLWMYSLLAAHRALAPYSIFEALADLNACLTATLDTREASAECLVLICIVQSEFSQTGLRSLYPAMIQKVASIH